MAWRRPVTPGRISSGQAVHLGRVGRAVWATRVVFAGNGILFATWVSRLPATRDRLGVDEAGLGLALLFLGLGSLLAMPWTGRVVNRLGARTVLTSVIIAGVVLFPALAVAPSLPLLAGALFVFGAASGVWDVAMNIAGNAVERTAKRTLMPGFHAAWSIGGITGAGLGALAAGAGMAMIVQFAAVAAVVGAVGVASALVLPAARDEPEPRPEPARGPGHHGPHPVPRPGSHSRRAVVAVALLTLVAAGAEGAANDWLALLLTDERGAAPAQAAAGFAVFTAAMTVGRLAGGRAVDRFGDVHVLRGGSVVATVGVAALLTVPTLPVAYVSAAAWGLGIAVAFPLAVSAAGRDPVRPARSISVASTSGYAAFLLGPPALGWLATLVGLGNALWLVVVMTLGIGALAPRAILSPRHGSIR
jgi:predicted MFS family arabinose efflux permease